MTTAHTLLELGVYNLSTSPRLCWADVLCDVGWEVTPTDAFELPVI